MELKPAWVRLHLVPQTEGHNMPSDITGLLVSETPNQYALTNVLEINYETGEVRTRDGMDFINKTYVWRCSILNEPIEEIIVDMKRAHGFDDEEYI